MNSWSSTSGRNFNSQYVSFYKYHKVTVESISNSSCGESISNSICGESITYVATYLYSQVAALRVLSLSKVHTTAHHSEMKYCW